MTETQVDNAVQASLVEHIRIGQYCIREQLLTEEAVYDILSQQFSMQLLTTIEDELNRELIRDMNVELFKTGRCLPLRATEDKIQIAVSDPLDLDSVLEISAATGLIVEPVLITASYLESVCRELFKNESFFLDSIGKISHEYEAQLRKDETSLTLDEIKQRTESEPVVKMVSLIFDEAIHQRASDIHIEPAENNAVIRFRVDGMLRTHMELTKWIYSPLTSRIKILAELDIAEKRIPQDGRIRYSRRGQLYDFRVSTLPTHYGEKSVIRILKHDLSLLDLANLGLEPDELQSIHTFLEKPQGMIFVTGPTGSGKSSTLFACLNRIKGKQINITTIENPIEYKLEGINQVQINDKAGVTFASTLRSILRQDPDVILVGEIRDRETAEIAVQASQTGHLVLSTLHTNDSVSAVTRLRDLGIPGFLISSSLLSIIAQRLVRLLCPYCKTKQNVSEELRIRWAKTIGEVPFAEAYFPNGCDKCGQSGFLGRKGIFELFMVNDEIRTMITDNKSEMQMRSFLRKNGMKTMVHNGIEKIRQGVTTPEEVMRVVLIDDILET
ncbi:MAG: type II/IV secretion system protein [Chitinivibrionales bacterium]|nr:type II/IV secretion system protein [Chitinivibrionales bacterium]